MASYTIQRRVKIFELIYENEKCFDVSGPNVTLTPLDCFLGGYVNSLDYKSNTELIPQLKDELIHAVGEIESQV